MSTPWWKMPADEWQAKQQADGASTEPAVDPALAQFDLEAGVACPKCEEAKLEELPEGGVHCPNCGFTYRLVPCT